MVPSLRVLAPSVFLLIPALACGQDLLEELVVSADATPALPEILEPDATATLTGGGNLEDVLVLEPNSFTSGGLGTRFALRGLTQEGTPTIGTRSNSSIGVILGTIPRSTNTLWGFGAPTWDTRAFEIIHGPVLFGPGAMTQGGLLRLEPNVPVFEHEGRFLFEAGEYGHLRSGLTENVVLIPDKLALRLNAARAETGGSITNVNFNDDEFAAFERDLWRGQLRWRPAGDDRSVWDLLVEAEQVRGNPLALATTLPGGDFFDRRIASDFPERVPIDRIASLLRGMVSLDPETRVEGEVTWQQLDGYQITDLDAGPVLPWHVFVGVKEQRWTGGARIVRERESCAWTAGIYAESSDYSMDFFGQGLAPLPGGSPFDSLVDEQVDMAAVFFRAEQEIAPQVRVFGGLRLDHQERDQFSRSEIAGGVTGSSRVESSSTEWLPELGVEWTGDDAVAGAKVGRAYRPPGAARAITLGTSQPYGAERGWEANLYASREWHDFAGDARVFYAALDNQQVPYVPAGGVPVLDEFIANAGRSRRAGAELGVTWSGPEDFSARVSGGYLFTEYEELVMNGVNRSGQEFPNAPSWTAGLELAWNRELGWFGESLLTWSDNSYSETGSPVATGLEKRLLLSARIGYRWECTELYLFGTNLLDEDFALVRHDYTAIGRGVDGVPSMPRLFGAGWAVEW